MTDLMSSFKLTEINLIVTPKDQSLPHTYKITVTRGFNPFFKHQSFLNA